MNGGLNMPRRRKIISGEAEFIIPWGELHECSVYIDSIRYDHLGVWFKKEWNVIPQFEVNIPDYDNTDTHIVHNAKVLIFIDNTMVFKGKIKEIDTSTEYYVLVKGKGIMAELDEREVDELASSTTDSELGRQRYSDVAIDTALNELCSVGGDGSSPWIVQPDATNNGSTYGNIFARFEGRVTRFNAIQQLVDMLGWQAWVTSTDSNYDTDRLNIAAQRSAVSSKTYNLAGDDQNAVMVNERDDRTELFNDLTLLCAGDGVSQLTCRMFAAVDPDTHMAYLTQNETDAATTIHAEGLVAGSTDLSTFPASGKIKIGNEIISYTGVNTTAHTFTGCTRGADDADSNATTALQHPKNGLVCLYYDSTHGYYVPSDPETGSSIDLYGLKVPKPAKVDKRIIYEVDGKSMMAAELATTKLLIDHCTPYIEIDLAVGDVLDATETLEVGETITIVDADVGIDDDYTVKSIEFTMDESGIQDVQITASNVRPSFIDIIQQSKQESTNAATWMQAQPNCYVVGENDNCDATHGLRVDFYIPDDAVAIDAINLNYKVKDYRVWSSAAASATHTHSGLATDGGNLGVFSSGVTNVGGIDDVSSSGWTTIYTTDAFSSTARGGVFWAFYFTPATADGYYVRLYDGTTYIPGSTYGYPLGEVEADDTVGVYFITGNPASKTYSLQIKSADEDGVSVNVSGSYYIIATHAHDLAIAASGGHTHTLTYGISETTLTADDISTVNIDGTDRKSALSISGVGDQQGLDIKSYLSTPIAGEWHYVTITPNGNCRIDADLFVKLFLRTATPY